MGLSSLFLSFFTLHLNKIMSLTLIINMLRTKLMRYVISRHPKIARQKEIYKQIIQVYDKFYQCKYDVFILVFRISSLF